MAKRGPTLGGRVAVISYNLDPTSYATADAVRIRDILVKAGYKAKLVHQWSLNENGEMFLTAAMWRMRFRGVVITEFYHHWNLTELIRSRLPIICANVGYVDNLGLGDAEQEHFETDDFHVVNNTHPISAGYPPVLDIGDPVWLNSTSTHNQHVNVLVTTLANHAVLVAHKTRRLVYFGWFRMSQASAGSALIKLLVKSASWAF